MIKIRLWKPSSPMQQPMLTHKCEECGTEDLVMGSRPVCKECLTAVPDCDSLIEKTDARIYYHKNGEVR